MDTAASALPPDKQRGTLPENLSFQQNAPNRLDPEMSEDRTKIVNEAIKDKIQVNLIMNSRTGGNAAENSLPYR